MINTTAIRPGYHIFQDATGEAVGITTDTMKNDSIIINLDPKFLHHNTPWKYIPYSRNFLNDIPSRIRYNVLIDPELQDDSLQNKTWKLILSIINCANRYSHQKHLNYDVKYPQDNFFQRLDDVNEVSIDTVVKNTINVLIYRATMNADVMYALLRYIKWSSHKDVWARELLRTYKDLSGISKKKGIISMLNDGHYLTYIYLCCWFEVHLTTEEYKKVIGECKIKKSDVITMVKDIGARIAVVDANKKPYSQLFVSDTLTESAFTPKEDRLIKKPKSKFRYAIISSEDKLNITIEEGEDSDSPQPPNKKSRITDIDIKHNSYALPPLEGRVLTNNVFSYADYIFDIHGCIAFTSIYLEPLVAKACKKIKKIDGTSEENFSFWNKYTGLFLNMKNYELEIVPFEKRFMKK